jgi:hypothetical protein
VKFVIIVAVVLTIAFLSGVFLVMYSQNNSTPTVVSAARQFPVGELGSLPTTTPSASFLIATRALVPTNTPTPSPTATPTSAITSVPTPQIAFTPTQTPASVSASLSGDISFHGEAPVNSRVVVFQKLLGASTYQLVVDNLTPIDGTLWQWNSPVGGDTYSVIAVLKQKQSDGSDADIAYSAPVTVTAPAGFIVLTVNSAYSLAKPTGTASVNCTTYNSGPNQNNWNVTVNFPSYSGAQSYWLEVGSTNGGNDIINTHGSALSSLAIFNNNTTYYARFAYAAVSGVDTGSGQYSVFSDPTLHICSK